MKTLRHRRFTTRLRGEAIELRHLLTALSFIEQTLFVSDLNGSRAMTAGDIDGDDDIDLLVAEQWRISWLENEDGQGTFGRPQVVALASFQFELLLADIDGDGDSDIVSSSFYDDDITLAWYENIDGKGTFGGPSLVISAALIAHSIDAADVDDDGDVDLISVGATTGPAQDRQVFWHDNVDGKGTFRSHGLIGQGLDFESYRRQAIQAIDFDGDHDADVFVNNGEFLGWYENTDGIGSFGEVQWIVDSGFQVANMADVDADGDFDIIAADSSSTGWLENTGGPDAFEDWHEVASVGADTDTLRSADMDGDGDLDIFSVSLWAGQFVWFENTDGTGNFVTRDEIDGPGHQLAVLTADVDGDRDLDVLSAQGFFDEVTLYENLDGTLQPPRQVVQVSPVNDPRSVIATDLDGDGDQDLLSASYIDNKVAWYENENTKGTFGTQQVITTLAGRVVALTAADFDGDGDQDVLSASRGSRNSPSKITWFENVDGAAIFAEAGTISTRVPYAHDVFPVDLDGDGDVDVLSAESYGVAWYENEDGKGTFGPRRVIAGHGAGAVFARDVDSDGDVDVLSASVSDGKISWYENIDGRGSFRSENIIATTRASSIFAADLDGDGDEDVLSGLSYEGVAWYENMDGKGTYGPKRTLTTEANEPLVYAADMDGDGDIDVLSASSGHIPGVNPNALDSVIAWYENTDGRGAFGSQKILTAEAGYPQSLSATDVDGDGDLDVLLASSSNDKIAWYENRLAGDADDDGEVAFSDFLRLSANFGRVDAVWEDGDFDASGSVTFADFLILSSNFDRSQPRSGSITMPKPQ